MTGTGGDPACWADRVCPACGMLDERAAGDRDDTCPHCGEPHDAHRADARQASPADDRPRHEPRSTTTAERELTHEDYGTAEHKEELERIGLDYRNLGTDLPPS